MNNFCNRSMEEIGVMKDLPPQIVSSFAALRLTPTNTCASIDVSSFSFDNTAAANGEVAVIAA
ncbi:MAG: hypothetical protein ACRDAM_20550 [Casimicrobium sp.]